MFDPFFLFFRNKNTCLCYYISTWIDATWNILSRSERREKPLCIVQTRQRKRRGEGEEGRKRKSVDRWGKFYSLDRLRERLLIRQGDDRHAFTGKSVVENEEEEEEGGLAPQFANFPQALCVGARPVNGLGDEVRERTRFGERRGGEADVRSNRLICARLARFNPLPSSSSSPLPTSWFSVLQFHCRVATPCRRPFIPAPICETYNTRVNT